jgi:hypothetical protein
MPTIAVVAKTSACAERIVAHEPALQAAFEQLFFCEPQACSCGKMNGSDASLHAYPTVGAITCTAHPALAHVERSRYRARDDTAE